MEVKEVEVEMKFSNRHGLVVAERPMPALCVLRGLFVDENARRKGHATDLVNRAVEWARDAGAVMLVGTLKADNMPCRRLLEKLGWYRAFVGYCPRHEHDVAMYGLLLHGPARYGDEG